MGRKAGVGVDRAAGPVVAADRGAGPQLAAIARVVRESAGRDERRARLDGLVNVWIPLREPLKNY